MANHEDVLEQREMFRLAIEEYVRRDDVHKGVWKTMEPGEEDNHILSKAKRWAHTRQEEDAIDLLNYVAFSLRNHRRRHESG